MASFSETTRRSGAPDITRCWKRKRCGCNDPKVTIFNRVTGHEDTQPSRELLALVRSHQMAGLILIDADTFSNTLLLDEAGIFRCAIMSRKVDSLSCPIVFPDMTGMIDLALDTLVSLGRKRIAMWITVGVYQESGEYIRHAIKARGLTTYERWLQIVPHEITEAVRNNVLMLMNDPSDRPDGIFVVDDNLAEGFSTGLVAAGISVPGVVS